MANLEEVSAEDKQDDEESVAPSDFENYDQCYELSEEDCGLEPCCENACCCC